MDEIWSVGTTSTSRIEAPTIESMLETVEKLRKAFPDMGQCLHWELIDVQKYFPAQQGTRCMCIRCKKLFVVPDHMLVTQKS